MSRPWCAFSKASASFLKKRSKKLSLHWACGRENTTVQFSKSFLVTFFQKSNRLPSLPFSLEGLIP
jgi:hypothetical protein